MELYEARDHYIIQDGNNSLWCNRFDGGMFAGTAMDLCSAWNPVCLGRVYGVIGKFRILPDDDWRLILIRNQSHVGNLPCGHPIYKVTRVVLLPLSINECTDLDIEVILKGLYAAVRIAEKEVQKSGKSVLFLPEVNGTFLENIHPFFRRNSRDANQFW